MLHLFLNKAVFTLKISPASIKKSNRIPHMATATGGSEKNTATAEMMSATNPAVENAIIPANWLESYRLVIVEPHIDSAVKEHLKRQEKNKTDPKYKDSRELFFSEPYLE